MDYDSRYNNGGIKRRAVQPYHPIPQRPLVPFPTQPPGPSPHLQPKKRVPHRPVGDNRNFGMYYSKYQAPNVVFSPVQPFFPAHGMSDPRYVGAYSEYQEAGPEARSTGLTRQLRHSKTAREGRNVVADELKFREDSLRNAERQKRNSNEHLIKSDPSLARPSETSERSKRRRDGNNENSAKSTKTSVSDIPGRPAKSVAGSEVLLKPEEVKAVVGTKAYTRLRNLMIQQQEAFAQQVWELRRLTSHQALPENLHRGLWGSRREMRQAAQPVTTEDGSPIKLPVRHDAAEPLLKKVIWEPVHQGSRSRPQQHSKSNDCEIPRYLRSPGTHINRSDLAASRQERKREFIPQPPHGKRSDASPGSPIHKDDNYEARAMRDPRHSHWARGPHLWDATAAQSPNLPIYHPYGNAPPPEYGLPPRYAMAPPGVVPPVGPPGVHGSLPTTGMNPYAMQQYMSAMHQHRPYPNGPGRGY